MAEMDFVAVKLMIPQDHKDNDPELQDHSQGIRPFNRLIFTGFKSECGFEEGPESINLKINLSFLY